MLRQPARRRSSGNLRAGVRGAAQRRPSQAGVGARVAVARIPAQRLPARWSPQCRRRTRSLVSACVLTPAWRAAGDRKYDRVKGEAASLRVVARVSFKENPILLDARKLLIHTVELLAEGLAGAKDAPQFSTSIDGVRDAGVDLLSPSRVMALSIVEMHFLLQTPPLDIGGTSGRYFESSTPLAFEIEECTRLPSGF
ncbi:hypothetical protein AXF42_Ash012525 [Apostasia shenzhenica]|uniref:Uncharacterized protein n=1 Tax=Apostasia shenzhenica TaxID=1088818 RepID=A0A2I0AR93_9ASPA|nr:hypothetical protein AXF42_Ash012525 [Apostasia shenzhenica]